MPLWLHVGGSARLLGNGRNHGTKDLGSVYGCVEAIGVLKRLQHMVGAINKNKNIVL